MLYKHDLFLKNGAFMKHPALSFTDTWVKYRAPAWRNCSKKCNRRALRSEYLAQLPQKRQSLSLMLFSGCCSLWVNRPQVLSATLWQIHKVRVSPSTNPWQCEAPALATTLQLTAVSTNEIKQTWWDPGVICSCGTGKSLWLQVGILPQLHWQERLLPPSVHDCFPSWSADEAACASTP